MSLQLVNIKKNFKQGEADIRVLNGLNATIKSGELVSIVGQSGSGKSTLLSLLAGLERVDDGQLLIDGTDISRLSENEMTRFRSENISIVFQQYHLVSHLTALENVMLPLEIQKKENAQEQAIKLLTELGLEKRMNHFPSQLSGGECQRVAIARALIVQPKMLLADEPSGNLDTKTGEKVMELFFEIARKYKMTTILVTHSEELAKKCQRQLQLSEGQLKEI